MNNKTINAAYASRLGAIALAAAVMTGCASTSNNPNDPLEGFNRTMFSFNDTVDKVALKPAAQAYDAVVPSPVQRGVGNFFGNIGDLWSSVNQLLQGRIEQGVSTFMRVAINTTFGLGGVLDVATEARLPREKSDFGQTLGKWGVGSGPYVVLPFFGPSTLRDTAACRWISTATCGPTSVRPAGAMWAPWCASSTAAPSCWMRRPCWKMLRWTSTTSCVTPTCNAARARSTAPVVAARTGRKTPSSPDRRRLASKTDMLPLCHGGLEKNLICTICNTCAHL